MTVPVGCEYALRLRMRRHAKTLGHPSRSRASIPAHPHIKTAAQHLLIKAGGRTHCVRISEIDWCEADGNYVRLHVGTRTLQIRRTMAEVSARLRPLHFIRISRTTIVNVDRIVELRPTGTGDYVVRLRGGVSRRLTRGYRNQFMDRFLVL